MYREQGVLVSSATDLVNHLACRHLTTLDLRQLDDPQPLPEDDPQLVLLQRKGDAWEAAYFERLKASGVGVVEIPRDGPRQAQIDATLAAMHAGASVIFQAALGSPGWFGRADFLRRVEQPSSLGVWSYEVLDTKLATHAKTAHVLQLCFYSWLLAEMQGVAPALMRVILGDGSERAFRYAEHAWYFHRLRSRLVAFLSNPARDTYPEPREKCAQCRWNPRCEAQRVADDHLWQVAGISRLQIRRLTADGITTLATLAAGPEGRGVPRMSAQTFAKLRRQAAMQLRGRQTGAPIMDLQEARPGRGLLRLPPPSEGDLYFDMEGDPLHEGGLEYLFGVSYREGGALRFRAFWGHTRGEEKRAFEQFMDFVVERIARYPDLHIYHYAAYENTALKRLMCLHGTREKEVDDLLRGQRLVDLYRVTVEGIVASTPSYSIKDIETFYRPAREGEVKSAGASVVAYEQWRESCDPALLESIERYNQDDCESTAGLHAWLLGLRPPELPWRDEAATQALQESPAKAPSAKSQAREAMEARKAALREQLLGGLPPAGAMRTADDHLREMAAFLLDFHRRCDKPTWWKIFSCQDMTEQELIDDLECIGAMELIAVEPPSGKARNPRWRYRYSEQDFKTREGKTCRRVDTLGKLTIEYIAESSREITFRPPTGAASAPASLSLTPPEPLRAEAPEAAVMRFAEALAGGSAAHSALRALLRKDLPHLSGREPGQPLVPRLPAELDDIIEAVAALQGSYLFIQGPPGAGKTYTGSHVIVELLRRGKRVGISSNSHKAIHNLLDGICEVARETGLSFIGVKKASAQNPESYYTGDFIINRDNNDDIDPTTRLVAGTAWLFADPAFDEAFDYLFVDEAGQVSLGHLVAMGVAATNIVLLGDQMQLPQPIQGVHPGRSGESTLEYLLDGAATISPERGIFLASTWRMHPDVCRFISDAVYDGRLRSAPGCERQSLLLQLDAHEALRPTGIRFWPVEHDECSQRSREEAAVVRELYASLLGQRWRNAKGREAPIGVDDILVVAPYNLQVRELAQALPSGARVGTVDKFQGQEAAVVIVSMATSSGEYLPRDIEFLYSLNRLNVALSRAHCLAVVVASPKLLEVDCRTPEQIRLVNTLCWIERYSATAVERLDESRRAAN